MKIKDKLKLGEVEIPACCKEQILKFYFLAFAIFVIGILITIMSSNWLSIVGTLLLTLIIAGLGYYRAYEISRYGYQKVEGVCTRIEYTLTSQVGGNLTKNIPKRYLITAKDRTYAIPYYRQEPLIQEGDHVLLYLKKESTTFEWRNVHTPDVIYGYEVLYNTEFMNTEEE